MFGSKKSTEEIFKMVKNGIAQAKENDMESEKIIIKSIQCNKAKELKRHRFESKGRATKIVKHQHHITLILTDNIKSKDK